MGIRETKKDNSELFKWDGKPSAGQVFPLAAQHVLAAVVGCVTPAILVANAANNAGGNVDMGLLIQMSLVFAALSTLLQLYGNKIRIGSGLPVIIGVSFAYVPTMTAIAAQAKSIDTILGAMRNLRGADRTSDRTFFDLCDRSRDCFCFLCVCRLVSYGGYAGGSCGDRRDRRSGSADPKSPGWIGDIRIQSLLRRSRNYVCIWNFLFLEMASL